MEKTLLWENYSMEKTMVLCLILWSFDLLWKNYGTMEKKLWNSKQIDGTMAKN